jgi:hypothetical protein
MIGFIFLTGMIHLPGFAEASPSSCAKDFIGKLVMKSDPGRIEPFTAKEIRAAIKASIKSSFHQTHYHSNSITIKSSIKNSFHQTQCHYN